MSVTLNNTTYLEMGDAAFASGLNGTRFDIAAGYLASGYEDNPWSKEDWDGMPGYKLPIWVAGYGGKTEAESCLSQLRALGVPEGSTVSLDMEERVDKTYVAAFGAIMQHRGYKVWVYGSADFVFDNPKLNGYWVADYTQIPFMYSKQGTRATQYYEGENYDKSLVKEWEDSNLWR